MDQLFRGQKRQRKMKQQNILNREKKKEAEKVVAIDWALKKPIIAYDGSELTKYETITDFKNAVNTTILCETGIPKSLFTIGKSLKIVAGAFTKQKRKELGLKKTDENDAKTIYLLYQENPELFKIVEEQEVRRELLKKKVKTFMRYEKVANSIQNMNQNLSWEYGEFEDAGKLSLISNVCSERRIMLERDMKLILNAHFDKETKELLKIKGLSFVLIAKLLAYADTKNHTLSQLKSYAGIAPQKGKQKGKDNKYSRILQMILLGKYHIVDEFIIQRTEPYRNIYDEYKERVTRERPEESKGHIDNMARRKVADAFLDDFLNICA